MKNLFDSLKTLIEQVRKKEDFSNTVQNINVIIRSIDTQNLNYNTELLSLFFGILNDFLQNINPNTIIKFIVNPISLIILFCNSEDDNDILNGFVLTDDILSIEFLKNILNEVYSNTEPMFDFYEDAIKKEEKLKV